MNEPMKSKSMYDDIYHCNPQLKIEGHNDR